MIAITAAISETEWRSMGQGDTAMGNQPSDYCAALPWERCAVYLSGGFFSLFFVVSYAFFLPFLCVCGLLIHTQHESVLVKKYVQAEREEQAKDGVYVSQRGTPQTSTNVTDFIAIRLVSLIP